MGGGLRDGLLGGSKWGNAGWWWGGSRWGDLGCRGGGGIGSPYLDLPSL